jgi:hypothetical protein
MRVRKSLERKTGFRDGRMIIIATEGSVTEVEYFSQLQEHAVLSPLRFQIKVIAPTENKSAPNQIIKSLTNFKKEYQIKADDELWMVIDRDRWTVQMLSEIHRQCKQKGIGLCISNPCFELWLILHYQDITTFGADTQELLLANQKQHGQSYAKRYISDLMENENLTDFARLFPLIPNAMENARLLRTFSKANIIDNLGSDVDFIFEGKL